MGSAGWPGKSHDKPGRSPNDRRGEAGFRIGHAVGRSGVLVSAEIAIRLSCLGSCLSLAHGDGFKFSGGRGILEGYATITDVPEKQGVWSLLQRKETACGFPCHLLALGSVIEVPQSLGYLGKLRSAYQN